MKWQIRATFFSENTTQNIHLIEVSSCAFGIRIALTAEKLSTPTFKIQHFFPQSMYSAGKLSQLYISGGIIYKKGIASSLF
jgi:hypothetical protein